MGPAQCGGETAKARTQCGGWTHNPARALLVRTNPQQRPRSSQSSHRHILTPGGIDHAPSVDAPGSLEFEQDETLRRLSCEGGTGVARRRWAMSRAARAGSQVAQWTTPLRDRQKFNEAHFQHD